jgi:type I restriction enzyme, S subunit
MHDSSVADLVDLVRTKRSGRKSSTERYVGLEHIASGGRLIGTAPASVSESVNGVFEPGDVLFGKLRPNLRKAVQPDFDGYCSTDILILRPKPEHSRAFVKHAMTTEAIFRHAEANSFGTRMPRTSWSWVAEASVWCPAFVEQGRIAEILDTLDDAIATTERLIAKLELERDGLRESLLVEPDERDWSEAALQELATAPICYGIVQPGRPDPDGVPVVTIGDLAGDFTVGLHRASRQLEARYARSRIDSGDVLLSVKATIGRVTVVPSHFRGNISRDVARIRLGSRVLPRYLTIVLSSHLGRKLLDRAVVGTTRAEVSIGPLQQLRLRYPDVEVQRRVVAVDDASSMRLGAELAHLTKLRLIRAGLADDLLSGRVRTVPL